MKSVKRLARQEAARAINLNRLLRECEARGGHDLGEREGPFDGYSHAPGKFFYERKCRHCGVLILEEGNA